MPQFSYTAVKKTGEKVTGQLEAPSELEVRIVLRAQSLRPVKIAKAGALEVDLTKLLSGGGRVGDQDLILFTRQLSILITSGVPLVQGLDAIIGQIANEKMKNSIITLKEKVTSGSFMWEAMRAQSDVFPDLYVSMIRAGEASGALDIILKRLISYLEDAAKLKRMVKGAMIYPIAISVIGIAVVIIMMVFVIPKFEDMLKGSGQELPAITQMVINMSQFFQHNIQYIIGVLGLVGYFGKKYLDTDEGRAFFDHWVIKVPIFGPILLKVAIARFSRTLQTLLSSGVNLLDAFDIVGPTVGNKTLSDEVARMRSQVEEGKTISAVMSRSKIFPSLVTQMVTVGENTGNLDKMLERVAEYYEQEVEALVANIGKLIEPVVLGVLGGFVAFIMVAMYLPIFTMANGVGTG